MHMNNAQICIISCAHLSHSHSYLAKAFILGHNLQTVHWGKWERGTEGIGGLGLVLKEQ